MDHYHPDWDILFDQSYMEFDLGPIKTDVIVYPSYNRPHGGTRMAGFYLLNLNCAKKLFENFLPFNIVIDFYYNSLFKKLNIKSFWSHPPNIKIWYHQSTCLN